MAITSATAAANAKQKASLASIVLTINGVCAECKAALVFLLLCFCFHVWSSTNNNANINKIINDKADDEIKWVYFSFIVEIKCISNSNNNHTNKHKYLSFSSSSYFSMERI